MIHDDDDGNLY